MNNINSILESLSEGMLTTAVAKGKGAVTGFFSDLLKGKVPKSVELDTGITNIYMQQIVGQLRCISLSLLSLKQ